MNTRRRTILVSFWGIFAPNVEFARVAQAVAGGKSLAEALGGADAYNSATAKSVEALATAHNVQIMVDPPVEGVPLSVIVAYLTSIGLGPEKVWTDTAANLLAQPYDFVIDMGEATCYHTVIVAAWGSNLLKLVNDELSREALRELRHRHVANSPPPSLGELVVLDGRF